MALLDDDDDATPAITVLESECPPAPLPLKNDVDAVVDDCRKPPAGVVVEIVCPLGVFGIRCDPATL